MVADSPHSLVACPRKARLIFDSLKYIHQYLVKGGEKWGRVDQGGPEGLTCVSGGVQPQLGW